jgi:hypothetical protein
MLLINRAIYIARALYDEHTFRGDSPTPSEHARKERGAARFVSARTTPRRESRRDAVQV